MKQLRHPKLLQLFGICSTPTTDGAPMYIITEYMCNGDLLSHLRGLHDGEAAGQRRARGSLPVPLATLIDVAAQVADAMTYLEGKN